MENYSTRLSPLNNYEIKGSGLRAVSLIFFTTQEVTLLVSHSHCITSDTYLGEGDPVYNTQTLHIDKNKKNV